MPVGPTLRSSARREEEGLIAEISCVDHERIALPVAPRVAPELANAWVGMWAAVQGDETHVVDVLLQNGHVLGSLEYVIVVVVRGG